MTTTPEDALLRFADFASPDRQDREETHDGHPCVLCGRKVRLTPRTTWLHLVDGGEHIAHPGLGEVVDSSGDLGWFPVGPECARRLPSAFRSATQYGGSV